MQDSLETRVSAGVGQLENPFDELSLRLGVGLARFELAALGGQHVANAMEVNQIPSLEMATDATSAKSGSFGRLAAEVGAALATPIEELISAHGEVGYHLAVADQFQNEFQHSDAHILG